MVALYLVVSSGQFFLPFSVSGNFLLKSNMFYWEIRTEVNRLSVGGFMFIWLHTGSGFMFAVAIGVRGTKFL